MGSSLRMLYVHGSPVPSNSANAVHVAKMCAAFQRAGTEVTLAVPGSPAQDPFAEVADAYGVRVRFRMRRMRGFIMKHGAWPYAINTLLQNLDHDVFYTRGLTTAAIAVALRRPTVLELHAPPGDDVFLRRFRWLARQPSLLRVVAISQSLIDELRRLAPEVSDRLLLARDGADPVAAPARVPGLADVFRVGYVGHLYPGKGMEIISALARDCPWAEFHIVGGTSEDVGTWSAALGHLHNLTFHGHVLHRTTSAHLAAMTVTLAPYQSVVRVCATGDADVARWTSPLKVFEYMAHGKAMIVSDLPVLREVLTDGHTALLRPPDAPQRWCDALQTLRDDPGLRTRLGEQARSTFLARYTWDRRAQEVLAAIEGVRTR